LTSARCWVTDESAHAAGAAAAANIRKAARMLTLVIDVSSAGGSGLFTGSGVGVVHLESGFLSF
jgi:hypothetical protein